MVAGIESHEVTKFVDWFQAGVRGASTSKVGTTKGKKAAKIRVDVTLGFRAPRGWRNGAVFAEEVVEDSAPLSHRRYSRWKRPSSGSRPVSQRTASVLPAPAEVLPAPEWLNQPSRRERSAQTDDAGRSLNVAISRARPGGARPTGYRSPRHIALACDRTLWGAEQTCRSTACAPRLFAPDESWAATGAVCSFRVKIERNKRQHSKIGNTALPGAGSYLADPVMRAASLEEAQANQIPEPLMEDLGDVELPPAPRSAATSSNMDVLRRLEASRATRFNDTPVVSPTEVAEDGEGPEGLWDDTSRTLVEECPTGLPVAGRSPTEALRRQIDDHELSEADADAVAILEAESGAEESTQMTLRRSDRKQSWKPCNFRRGGAESPARPHTDRRPGALLNPTAGTEPAVS